MADGTDVPRDEDGESMGGGPDGGTALGSIQPIEIQEEMEQSFLDYAMSVIVSRALPDARDGLKPVHRRILWGMYDLGARPDRPTMKCARVTGEVMGKYHPHGDQAIYDALVRMGQDFSRHASRTSWSTAARASPWAWPPTSPATTWARWSTPPST